MYKGTNVNVVSLSRLGKKSKSLQRRNKRKKKIFTTKKY